MRQLFVLSKDNVELAKEEVLALYKPKGYLIQNGVLLIESELDFAKRLAYTHQVFEFLFFTDKKEIVSDFQKFDWNKIYKKSFVLRSHILGVNEKDYAKYIWNNIKKPVVDLEKPKTPIHLIAFDGKIAVCLLKHDADKSFFKRKPHLNPAPHPTGINPKLAIACINLTGKTKGKLLDPFCGAGGVLIEAGLLGYKTVGYDISEDMIVRAKKNLAYYKIKDYKLKTNDATKSLEKADLVVTDLPYGKNSVLKQDLDVLAKAFFKKLASTTDNAVVLIPDFLKYKKLIGDFKVKHEFSYYFHKSLSRKILVLTK